MADVTIQIETVDSSEEIVSGIISVYTSNYGLVARTTTQGTAVFTLDDSDTYVISMTASNIIFNNTTISPTEGAIFRLQGASSTIPSPSDPELCVVYGNVYRVDGTSPSSFSLSVQAMSGELSLGEDILANTLTPLSISSNPKGELNFELYKNRYYRVVIGIDDYYEEPTEVIHTYVGDLTSMPLSSFLYPKVSTINFTEEIVGDGDYSFSLTLTNGRTVTSLSETSLLILVAAENVDAELQEADGVSYLRIRNAGSGSRVQLFGYRRSLIRDSDSESSRGSSERLLRTISF